MQPELERHLLPWRQQIDARLGAILEACARTEPGEGANPHDDDPLHLNAAMREAVLAGGKRLRPCLVIAAARAVGGAVERDTLEQVLDAACAVELVHCYSLVHDDLPAMDDDGMRRGRPTCHKQYGEAAAILAGDALLTLAFEVLAAAGLREGASAQRLIGAARELARAAGAIGMVGGQAIDMAIKERSPSFTEVERCHLGKTAALFSASAAIGALVGGGSEAQVDQLRRYGLDLGLAFQHADDLRDGDFALHRERAGERCEELSRQAAGIAATFGPVGEAGEAETNPLVALADFVNAYAREIKPQ